MKKKINKKFLAVGVAVVVLLGGVTVFWLSRRQPEPLPVDEPIVEEIDESQSVKLERLTDIGEVSVMPADTADWQPAQDGQLVSVGSRVKTDEQVRAQLVYPDNSVTRLDSGSEVELTAFAASPTKVNVSLHLGRIWSRVASLVGTGGSYQAETDTVVAAVRGTSYGIEKQIDDTNEVIVSESKVDCECKDVDQQWTVGPGWRAGFSCQEGEEVDTAKLTQADLDDEWYVFNLNQDEKLNQRFGKEHYQPEEPEDDMEDDSDTIKGEKTDTEDKIKCTGPDGVEFMTTKEECEAFKKAWEPTPTPTPHLKPRKDPTPTSPPEPTSTPEPVPTESRTSPGPT
jgi:hypothetical protein